VGGLAAEKAAQYEARMQAETRLANLEAELSSACSELESAKHTGTPKGEWSCPSAWAALQAGCRPELFLVTILPSPLAGATQPDRGACY
jgi:hypothetical protein